MRSLATCEAFGRDAPSSQRSAPPPAAPSPIGANGRASFSRDAQSSQRSAPTPPSPIGANGCEVFSRDALSSERSAPPPTAPSPIGVDASALLRARQSSQRSAPPSPPRLGKRAPMDVNQGLLPLQTALNGDPAMSDFQTAGTLTGFTFSCPPSLGAVG